MGYVLIAVGVALVAWGVMVVMKPKGGASAVADQVEQSTEAQPEEMDNYAKGLAFEEFVVQRFNNKFFTVKEWRSDKQVDGVFAESSQYPDLEINFKLEAAKIDVNFALECKWRKDFYRNSLKWSTDNQIERYNAFARERDLPVFVVLGVGGEPNDPKEMYVVPLEQLQKPTVSAKELKPYKRKNPTDGFYWEAEEGYLR